jgi:hypothetical protein
MGEILCNGFPQIEEIFSRGNVMDEPGTKASAMTEPVTQASDALPAEDRWKEQIAFLSGYVLVSGASAMQLWSSTAAFQTGRNISFWSMDLPGQGDDVHFIEYQFLTAALSFALTAIFLSVIHILARGIWLGIGPRSDGESPTLAVSQKLKGLSEVTYDATLFLVFVVLGFLIFNMFLLFSTAVEHIFLHLHVWPNVAGWTGRIASVVALFGSAILAWTKMKDRISQTGAFIIREVGSKAAITSYLGILLSLMIATQSCYTASIGTAGQIFHQQRDDEIELHLDLGGATSAKEFATVTLQDEQEKKLQIPAFQDMGDGHYLALLRSRNLAAGRYHVALEYPHWNFSAEFPFIQTRISVERWFLVVP